MVIEDVEKEIGSLTAKLDGSGPSQGQLARLKDELKEMRETNLRGAEFEEKRRLIELFDVKVYPSEDLKNVRIRCGSRNDAEGGQGQTSNCGKVLLAPQNGSI